MHSIASHYGSYGLLRSSVDLAIIIIITHRATQTNYTDNKTGEIKLFMPKRYVNTFNFAQVNHAIKMQHGNKT